MRSEIQECNSARNFLYITLNWLFSSDRSYCGYHANM
jgi:hypothetical protein